MTTRGGLSLVEIEWRDSLDSNQPATWQELGEAQQEQCDDRLFTVGYIVKEDRHYVWLVQHVHQSGQSERVRVGRVYLIPHGCIIKRRKL